MKNSDDDKTKAINSIRLLAFGIPILSDDGEIIGWIEKPNLDACKYLISKKIGDSDSKPSW